jgi:hypothetical protein
MECVRLNKKAEFQLKLAVYCIILLSLVFIGPPALAQRIRTIADNGRPLTFQIIRVQVTQDLQSMEHVQMVLPASALSAASSQAGYTYRGPITEDIQYQPIQLMSSESFLIIEFSISNVRRKLELSSRDVSLVDSVGATYNTLGASSFRKANSWNPMDYVELNPHNKNNVNIWIFKLPTDIISHGLFVKFDNATYPVSITK